MALIIVADSHVQPGSARERDFFGMLAQLARHRCDVVFLGDIFELWIALPGYEGPSQKRFLQWCRRHKSSRNIGFIEGNHEFFVSAEHGDCFSWSSSESYRRDERGNLFVHGDRINRRDRRYLMFRRLTKNAATKALLKRLPGGPRLCMRLSRLMRHTNRRHRQGVPERQVRRFAQRMFAAGAEQIFVGHFHSAFSCDGPSGRKLYLLPAWFEAGQVTLVDSGSNRQPVRFLDAQTL